MALTVSRMADLLQQYADQLGDLPAVVTALNTASIEHRDSRRKLMGDIKDVVGADATRRLLDSMDAASASDALIRHATRQLTGQGLDLTDDDVRSALDQLAALPGLPMTADDAAAVKAIGIWSVTPHHAAGGTGDATLAEVQAGATCLQLREWLAGKYQDAMSQIASGTLTTQAEVIAALEA